MNGKLPHRPSRAGRLVLLVGILSISSGASLLAQAEDRVELTSGERLLGEIVGGGDGAIHLQSRFFPDPIDIPVDSIEALDTRQAFWIRLESGERLRGEIGGSSRSSLEIQSVRLGAISLDWVEVVGLTPVRDGEVPEPERSAGDSDPEVEEPEAPPAEAPPEESDPLVEPWSLSLSFQGGIQDGNRDGFDSHLNLEVHRETPVDRFDIRFRFNAAEVEGVRTARNWFGRIKLDHFFRERFYAFVASETSQDEFKDLDLRSASSFGCGFIAVDNPRFRLEFEAGFTHIFEDFETDEEERLAARLASKFRWKLHERLDLSHEVVVFPGLEDGGFNLRDEAALTAELLAGFELKLSFVLEHDTEVPDGTEKTDIYGLAGIAYRLRF